MTVNPYMYMRNQREAGGLFQDGIMAAQLGSAVSLRCDWAGVNEDEWGLSILWVEKQLTKKGIGAA